MAHSNAQANIPSVNPSVEFILKNYIIQKGVRKPNDFRIHLILSLPEVIIILQQIISKN